MDHVGWGNTKVQQSICQLELERSLLIEDGEVYNKHKIIHIRSATLRKWNVTV